MSEVFQNVSDYDYYLIIKEVPKYFEGELSCVGENTEKCKTFAVPITKEFKKVGKSGE